MNIVWTSYIPWGHIINSVTSITQNPLLQPSDNCQWILADSSRQLVLHEEISVLMLFAVQQYPAENVCRLAAPAVHSQTSYSWWSTVAELAHWRCHGMGRSWGHLIAGIPLDGMLARACPFKSNHIIRIIGRGLWSNALFKSSEANERQSDSSVADYGEGWNKQAVSTIVAEWKVVLAFSLILSGIIPIWYIWRCNTVTSWWWRAATNNPVEKVSSVFYQTDTS